MNESIQAKIFKLLALALDQAGTPEGDRANEAVARLLERHNVTLADVEVNSGSTKAVAVAVDMPRVEWRVRLYAAVAWFFDVELHRTGKRAHHFVGLPADVDLATYTASQLTNRLQGVYVPAWKRHLRRKPTRTDIFDYRVGWVVGVTDMLTAVKASAFRREGLVVAKKAHLDRAITARGWIVSNSKAAKIQMPRISAATCSGYKTGKQVGLHAGVHTGQQQRRLASGVS